MNAVEIEEAISQLAEQPFVATEFPYAFLEAFGNKETTIKRLKTGGENKSDIGSESSLGVLQRNNIHIAVCRAGEANATLQKLRISPATEKFKAKFILATDGIDFEAEDILTGETVACRYSDFPNHFGFFLALAGISTIKQIRESSFDIRATSRLNRLYVELLKNNPDWSTAERRHDMNHFMARLIFCFFAEDTDIFNGNDLFTATIDQMSARDSSDIDWVISETFRAMNTPIKERAKNNFRPWADAFPYVNGGLFSGSTETPKFTKIARSYLLHVGSLDWTKINPDIFGSMIQAVADDEERGALGMHYTSVPNILKVLNPLFLDDLRAELEAAGDNPRKLLHLRKRMAHIRVFDPACGSGNFLVIAYKQMREIEAEINKRRGELHLKSEIPLTNFRGIELRDFSAEIARLALIIAEYQCDVVYIGQKEALQAFLPLDSQNWITCGNALRLDWLTICPPTGTGVKLVANDLFSTPLDQAEIDFENEGGETYICGNPPYVGDKKQTKEQKSDLEGILARETSRWRSLDYIAGFFYKASQIVSKQGGSAAFVTTNSICQGQQVNALWPLILRQAEITSAHTSFKWANLAANNAGVTVIIVQLSSCQNKYKKRIFEDDTERLVTHISPYLTSQVTPLVTNASQPLNELPTMTNGCAPKDGGNLLLNHLTDLPINDTIAASVVKEYWGSDEIISGIPRYCLWINDSEVGKIDKSHFLSERIKGVRESRLKSEKLATREWAKHPHRFVEIRRPESTVIIAMPAVATEKRQYLTPVLLPAQNVVVTNAAFVMYDPSTWVFGLLTSRLHHIWIKSVCGQLETRIRYSNTLGWNTFPVPKLTEKNKQDLTRCAEDILLAREVHFPATIADLYDPDNMPENLRRAHDRNDEVLERIYIGRRFKNDTERLEKLFELYTKMKK
ncbi:DNA methyltransferase [Methylophilus sp. Leaf408]|uniref:class I SAM-dependent DNA methyltransferase n=1 Tax=Methylophilus sp. Leaf408 TaxID=2876561 RepID=UPI001E32507B|nr:DNA methyltransferase [Methylophilus sp. Leaf408]